MPRNYEEISTRRGDDGQSDMFSGERRSKSDAVFEALGDLDELNSYLGVVRQALARFGAAAASELLGRMDDLQQEIMAIASVVATDPASKQAEELPGVGTTEIARLEADERQLRAVTDRGTTFAVPGRNGGVPELDVARALTRRCERRIVAAYHERSATNEKLEHAQRYLNRLADYFFVAARHFEQSGQ